MKQLAELLQNVPGIKSIELEDVQGLAQLLRDAPEIGSIEVKGLFGTKVVITRTGTGAPAFVAPPISFHGAAPAAHAAAAAAASDGGAARARPVPRRRSRRSSRRWSGTFYKSPEPGAEAYVKVGTRVTAGADGVHHRGDEDHERDRGRDRRRGPRGAGGRRPAGRVRAGPLPGRSQWLSPPLAAGRRRSPRPTFNFKQTIAQMVQRNASDLLLKVGRPPTVRLNGELQALEMPPVKPEDLKMLAEQVMTPRQVKEFAEKKEADFAIGVPGVGRFRTNIYQQRGTLAFAFRAIPYEVKTIVELHLPRGARGDRAQAPRADPGHRHHRLGQVDRAGGDDQSRQPEPPGERHHDRGPDRVPAPRRDVQHLAARGRAATRCRSRPPSATCCGRTPT